MQEKQENVSSVDRRKEEIDITEYIAKLWKNRSRIVIWGVLGAIVGVVVGFSIPKTYKAGAMLAPETEQDMGSSISGIASMIGVGLNKSVDAIGVEMFPDVAHSTPFIVGLFDVPVQFERKDSMVNTTLLDYMLNYQKKPWWSPIVGAPMKVLQWCISLVKEEDEEGESGVGPRNFVSR